MTRRRITQEDLEEAGRRIAVRDSVWKMADEGTVVVIAPRGMSKTALGVRLGEYALGLKSKTPMVFLLDAKDMTDEEKAAALKDGVDSEVPA